MSDNPFRRRPFIELGIDSWKAVVLAAGFLLLVFWMVIR
jgi:hypothetical protein